MGLMGDQGHQKGHKGLTHNSFILLLITSLKNERFSCKINPPFRKESSNYNPSPKKYKILLMFPIFQCPSHHPRVDLTRIPVISNSKSPHPHLKGSHWKKTEANEFNCVIVDWECVVCLFLESVLKLFFANFPRRLPYTPFQGGMNEKQRLQKQKRCEVSIGLYEFKQKSRQNGLLSSKAQLFSLTFKETTEEFCISGQNCTKKIYHLRAI